MRGRKWVNERSLLISGLCEHSNLARTPLLLYQEDAMTLLSTSGIYIRPQIASLSHRKSSILLLLLMPAEHPKKGEMHLVLDEHIKPLQ